MGEHNKGAVNWIVTVWLQIVGLFLFSGIGGLVALWFTGSETSFWIGAAVVASLFGYGKWLEIKEKQRA